MGLANPVGALSSATNTIFACPKLPTGQRIFWRMKALTLNNDSGSSSTINVYLVPSGGSLGVTNKLINTLVMANGTSFSSQVGEHHNLDTGDTIQITASAPHASLVYRASFEQVNVFIE